MSVFDLPTLSTEAQQLPAAPTPTAAPAAQGVPIADRSNALVAGVKVGSYGLLGQGAGFLSGGAKLVGADGASQYLGQKANQFAQDAAAAGRPDIDKAGFTGDGVTGFVKKGLYEAGQLIPGLVGGVAAASAATAALPAEGAAVGAAGLTGLAARVGQYIPEILGGGSEAAGARAAAAIAGGSALSVPTTIGGLVNQQAQQPGGLTRGGAAAAFGLGIPAGVAGALLPGEGAILAKGEGKATGAIASAIGDGPLGRFVDHGIKNAALGAVGAGAGAAAQTSLDPNLSAGDRAQAILAAAAGGAVTGGLIGGGIGAAFGHAASTADQQTVIDSSIKAIGFDPDNPSGKPAPAPTPPPAPAGGDAAASPVDYVRLPDGSFGPSGAPLGLPAPAPSAQPTAPEGGAPPQTVIQKALADAGITKFSSKGELGKFVSNSTAQSLPELYNEIDKVGDTSALAGLKMFGKLADHLGVGKTDLEEQLTKAKAAETPDQATIDTLNRQLGLRDEARQLPGAKQPEAPAPAPEPQPVPAAPGPRDAAPGRMITAPTFEGDIPELTPAETGTSPAVPTDTQVQPSGTAIKELGPEITAPLPPVAAAGDAGLERAPAPGEVRPAEPDAGVTPAGPQSIADKVLAAARDAVGAKGGEVDIASIRAALPDIHPNDLENALREIHADDSENSLTQNPKGQRKGVDGVQVEGQGRFQKLELEPQEAAPDAAEVGSAAPEAGADQPGGPAPVGGGDAFGEEAARTLDPTGQAEAEAGLQGAPEPADQGTAAPTVDAPPAAPQAEPTFAPASQKMVAALGSDSEKGGRIITLADGRKLLAVKNEGTGSQILNGEYMLEGIGPDGKIIPRPKGADTDFGRTVATSVQDLKDRIVGGHLDDRINEVLGGAPEATPTPAAAPAVNSNRPSNPFEPGSRKAARWDAQQTAVEQARAARDADVAQASQRRAAISDKIDTNPREVVPTLADPPGSHPIAGQRNALASYINGLSDGEAKSVAKDWAGSDYGGSLTSLVGDSADPPGLQSKIAQSLKTEATDAKLAPAPVENASPAQVAQDAQKATATANILAAPEVVKDAGKPVTQKLRKQTRAKTAMIETAAGDQVPTETVGASAGDIPQSAATSADRLVTAGPADIMPKMPSDRMPGVVDTHPIADQDALRQHFDTIVSKLRPDVQENVHFLDGPEDLPQALREQGAAQGHDFSTYTGIYHDGQVYVFGKNNRSLGELQDTVSHEVFGHLGNALRYDRSSDFGSALSRVYDQVNGADGAGFEQLARRTGVWDQNEDGHNLGSGSGLKDYLPRLFPDGQDKATPMQKARAMDELMAHAAQKNPTPFDKVVTQIQVSARKAIVNTLRRAGLTTFAKRLDTFGQPELAKWLSDTRAALRQQPKPGSIDLAALSSDPRQFIHDMDPLGSAPFMARVAGQQRDYQGALGLAGSLRDHILGSKLYETMFGPKNAFASHVGVGERAAGIFRTFINNIAPSSHFAEQGKHQGMPTLRTNMDGNHAIDTMRARLNQTFETVTRSHYALRSADRVQAKRLERIMDISTRNNLDPTIPFDQHHWLTDTKTPEEMQGLAARHADIAKEFNDLGNATRGGKKTGGQQVYRDQVAASKTSWYAQKIAALHDTLSTVFKDKVDAGHNPFEEYAGLNHGTSRASEALHGDIHGTQAFMKSEFDRLQAIAKEHLTGEGSKPENEGTAAYKDLAKMVSDHEAGEQGYVKQGPYFRLGREGDYTVGFKIKPELDADGKETGRPDREALAAIQAHMEKHYPEVSIGRSDTNRSVFMKFDSQMRANDVHNLFAEGGPLHQHIDQEHGTSTGLISQAGKGDGAVAFLDRHIDDARAKFETELANMPDKEGPEYKARVAERDKYLGTLRATIMDLSGDNSLRSIQSQRQNVQGSSTDMLGAQQHAQATVTDAVTRTAVRSRQADALAQARQAIDNTRRSGEQGATNKASTMQRTYDAYVGRNEAASKRVNNSFFSWVKSGLHAYQLGASPAYVIMNLSQIASLGVPELAKFHGFARTIPALVRALGPATRVIAAMAAKTEQADGTIGRGIVHGGLSKNVLDRARLNPRDRETMSTMTNHGHFELGSYTGVNGGAGVTQLGAVGRWMHYANTIPLMAETYSRIVMGLAAAHLHETMPEGKAKESLLRQFPDTHGTSKTDYAGHVVQESMQEWGSYNTPKFMTAGGVLGQAGPVITQFHGWVPRLVSKLYKEAANGYTNRLSSETLSGDALKQARKEAQRFTNYHLAAVTAMSGTLGLPLAGYTAGLLTRGSSLFEDQPTDVEGGIRGFLANTLGKDAGEIAAHGLPRYLGVDMSELGDNDFAPLARLIEDKRKWEDAVPDYLAHAWGSSGSAILNFGVAAREMSEGRFAEAGARALPTSIRNIVRAYQVDKNGGYVNQATGQKLPVQGISTGAEVLKNLLGVTGGQVAEERERQDTLSGLKDVRKDRQDLIQRDLLKSYNNQDRAGVQKAYDDAKIYDQDNPGLNLVSQLPGIVRKSMLQAQIGMRTGVVGLQPKDRLGREAVNY